jgi:hypothetical protein
MTSALASSICAVLSLMEAFAPWKPETAALLEERYLTALLPIPQAVGMRMIAEVDRRFDKRPSIKALLDWASGLEPAKPFDIADLDRKPSNHLQLVGPVGEKSYGSIEETREEMRRFFAAKASKNPAAPKDLSGDWGLIYEFTSGRKDVMTPKWSEAEAKRKADAWNAKPSSQGHCTCRVYHRNERREDSLSGAMGAALEGVIA